MVFQRFWKSGLHSKDQKNWFPNRQILHKCQGSGSDLRGRIETCSRADLWICIKKKRKTERVFQIYRTLKFLMRWKQQQYDITIYAQKFQCFSRDQDGRYQTSGHGKFRVSKARWINLNTIVWKTGRSVFQVKEQKRTLFHRRCFWK